MDSGYRLSLAAGAGARISAGALQSREADALHEHRNWDDPRTHSYQLPARGHADYLADGKETLVTAKDAEIAEIFLRELCVISANSVIKDFLRDQE
jgi:hypothetical protein